MQLPAWWTWWCLWSFFKFITPIVISIAALSVVLYDRRPHLEIAAKRGAWYVIKRTHAGEVLFQGIVDVYNTSSRANSIRDYRFYCEIEGGWREMESEQYLTGEMEEGGKPQIVAIHNQTAITLPPFSAMELKVQAFVQMPTPKRLTELFLAWQQGGKEGLRKVYQPRRRR